MTAADVLEFLKDIAMAILAGALASGFIATAVIAIVLNERRARAKARRNLEAQCDALRAAAPPSGGVIA